MSDLTILEQMRDEMRGMRADHRELRVEMMAGFAAMHADMKSGFEASNARFEVIETTIRDLAQQLVMLSRGIKVALEGRAANDGRLEDHERRIGELERSSVRSGG